MKHILCYGDSNTWGAKPLSFDRYGWDERWTGVMSQTLGSGYHIYENGLNGRTTVFDDPVEIDRNGRIALNVTMMVNAPLDLVIVMLGTNDIKDRICASPWDIGWGMELLVKEIKKPDYGYGKPPQVLIAAPVVINTDWEEGCMLYTMFSDESVKKSKELPQIYEYIAKKNDCHFIDVSKIVKPERDGVHLLEHAHATVGKAMAAKVLEILG